MKLEYKNAYPSDADLLIEIYNAAFYEDYVKYGQCPAYNRNHDKMVISIGNYPKQIIYCGNKPIGVVSMKHLGEGVYDLGCLCVIPEYQHMGIGTATIKYVQDFYSDWKEIRLLTPADKRQNVLFYTQKCGFKIVGVKKDGSVNCYMFSLKRKIPQK